MESPFKDIDLSSLEALRSSEVKIAFCALRACRTRNYILGKLKDEKEALEYLEKQQEFLEHVIEAFCLVTALIDNIKKGSPYKDTTHFEEKIEEQITLFNQKSIPLLAALEQRCE